MRRNPAEPTQYELLMNLVRSDAEALNEVFSPGIRTPLKCAGDAAGQACSQSSGT